MSGNCQKCCISGCGVIRNKRKENRIKLHKFPRGRSQSGPLKRWLQSLKLRGISGFQNITSEELSGRRICHNHFEKRFITAKNYLISLAYPSLFTEEEIASGKPFQPYKDLDSLANINKEDHGYSRKEHDDHTYCLSKTKSLGLQIPLRGKENKEINLPSSASSPEPLLAEENNERVVDLEGDQEISEFNTEMNIGIAVHEMRHAQQNDQILSTKTNLHALYDCGGCVECGSNEPAVHENQEISEITENNITVQENQAISEFNTEINIAVQSASSSFSPAAAAVQPTKENSTVIPIVNKRRRIVNKLKHQTPEYKALYKDYIKMKGQLKYAKKSQKKPTKEDLFNKLTAGMEESTKSFFWAQINLAKAKPPARRFNEDEMVLAMSLYNESHKCYNLLSKVFIMPSKSIVNKWLQELKNNQAENSGANQDTQVPQESDQQMEI